MRLAPAWPAALLAGVAQTFSFAPFEHWWLQIAALAVLAALAADASAPRAALLGWLFGVGWLVSGLWWLYISMHDFGGMAPALAALAVFVLAALLALYYAAALALFARCRRGRPLADGVLFAACWLLAELARGVFFTGFPWIASGYAHAVGPLAAWAPWIGVYGLCALAAWLAYGVAAVLRPGAARGRFAGIVFVGLAAAAIAAPLALPSGFTRSSGELNVSLLQPSIAQNQKFDPALMQQHLQALAGQIGAARATLVVTPESVIPFTRSELSGAYWNQLVRPFAAPGRALLVGIFLGNEDEGFVNSVVGVSGDAPGKEYHYGKRHLLPFGEFVPPGFRWFVDLMKIPLGDQVRGSSSAPFDAGGQRLRPLICFEDLFGEEMVESVVGADPATLFVNVSNLAWFGPRLVQDQQLQFSQMRALEFERGVIRSTNTGATAVVDHHGRVTARLPPLVRGTLDASVEGRVGETPYARWLARAGLWPLALLALGALLVLRRRG